MTHPKIVKKEPWVQECSKGKYAWCSCGHSQKDPACDGSHRGTDFLPLKVVLEEDQTVAWCACKRTKTPPYCDGSHSDL